jgi:PAS domain-containing protein
MKIKFLKKEDMSITILAKTNLVVYVDKALVNILGSRIWIGRRLTDHLYENDRVLLQSKLINITEKINAGFKKIHEIEPFYLRILKTSDSSQETKTSKKSSNTITFRDMIGRQFLIFKVDIKPDTVEFKNVEDSEKTSSSSNIQPVSCHDLNLETCFTLKLSFPCIAYNQKQMNSSVQSEDSNEDRTFITEHNTNLKITRVENRVCELLGFLPQDLANRSLLKLIHPEDLEKIKKIHSDMYHKNQLQNFESYRWRCFNGSFVTVKSQWSCLKHPWKEHIDYIVGKHLIIDEPSNKNIFDESSKEDRGMLYRVDQDNNKTKVSFKENLKIVEKEIIELISEKKFSKIEEESQFHIREHFFNEHLRKMKKRQRQKCWRMKQMDQLRMFHKKNRLQFDEELYFFRINSKFNALSMDSSSTIKHQIGKIAEKIGGITLDSFSAKNKFNQRIHPVFFD